MTITKMIGAGLCAALLSTTFAVQTAQAQGVLRIGMTVSDIPRTLGQPDQGFEGLRFGAFTMYDSLTLWDLTSAEKASEVVPGLAVSWEVDASDKTKWIFKLREGVTFHDGSPFNADAVVWNAQKFLDDKAPHYDPSQVGVTAAFIPSLRGARKIDDMTVELTTAEPDSFLPINLTNLYFASPTHWQKIHDSQADGADRAARTWTEFAKTPSGTGPWKLDVFVPRERLELLPNAAYWDESRRPKLERLVLLPMPEPNARTAALLAGQVDWIEAPAPDAIPTIKAQGFQITSNKYPHVWPWQFSRIEGSPWNDLNVRRAANLCIDREGLSEGLLGGFMVPAKGIFPPEHFWFGKPEFDLRYDLKEGQRLMAESGFSETNRLKVKTQISTSGSGQILPLAMNEYMQQALAECYFDVEFDVTEWNTLLNNWRRGADDPVSNGAHAINVSSSAMDPVFAMVRFLHSEMAPPRSVNWGRNNNPVYDALILESRQTFDPKERDQVLAKLHATAVDDAAFLWVGHDVAPRAMSSKVQGFVQPQSWFLNFSSITMAD